jgi:hypothetical protein
VAGAARDLRSPRPPLRALLAVVAACLALPAFALAQSPSPQPLWQAYPLEEGSAKPKPKPPSEQPAAPSVVPEQPTAPSGATEQPTAPNGATKPSSPSSSASEQSTAPSGATKQSSPSSDASEQSAKPDATGQSNATGGANPQPANDASPAAPPKTRSAPFAVTLLFFAALGAIVLLGGAWLLRRAWSGLEAAAADEPPRRRVAGSTREATVPTCEITWSPGQAGAAFLATVDHPGEGPDLIAESPAFGPPGGGPPPETPATKVAHEQLVRTLEGDGWRPVGRGGDWYSVRFRRSPTSTSTKEGTT